MIFEVTDTQATPKQQKFLDNWLIPSSETFGNAYQSAIKAGFSPHYAQKITAKSTDLDWMGEIRRQTTLKPIHIIKQLEHISLFAPQIRDQLTAISILTKVHGMQTSNINHDVSVKFVNTVPRPKLIA